MAQYCKLYRTHCNRNEKCYFFLQFSRCRRGYRISGVCNTKPQNNVPHFEIQSGQVRAQIKILISLIYTTECNR